MSTIASCGHRLKSGDNGTYLKIMDFQYNWSTESVGNVIMSGIYCKDCCEDYKKNGLVLHTEQEEKDWLDGKKEYPEIKAL